MRNAYDIFMMIYIDVHCLKHSSATKALLKDMHAYRTHVTTMMKDGGGGMKWAGSTLWPADRTARFVGYS